MPTYATARRIGMFLSVATCALAIAAQTKSLLLRQSDDSLSPELSTDLGVESAWPHLRQDLGVIIDL